MVRLTRIITCAHRINRGIIPDLSQPILLASETYFFCFAFREGPIICQSPTRSNASATR